MNDRLMATRGVSTVVRGTYDDGIHSVRSTRDGAVFSAEWFEGLAQEGRVYVANVGTVTTPITFGAGVIDTTEPDMYVIVPLNTTIIPLELRIYMEAYGTNAQFECMASCGTGGSTTAPTGGTAVTPANARTDNPRASACTVYGNVDASGATYMTTNVAEFFRAGQQFAITKTTASATAAVDDPNLFIWRRKDMYAGPVVVGAAQLAVFAASQAGTGFITLVYAEVPSSSIV